MSEVVLDLCQAAVERSKLPGLAVSIVSQDEPLLSAGFGHGIDADTLFPIASCTKPFTAELLLRLADEGSLDLDARVCRFWPGYQLSSRRWTELLTVRDLLCHRQPLPSHPWAWIFCDADRERFLSQRVPHLELLPDAPPGRYHYSNIQYASLGHLVEVLGKTEWMQTLETTLLKPLGMHRTDCASSDWANHPNTAQPHRFCDSGTEPITPFHARRDHPIAPASELLSSANDLQRWLTYLLARGRAQNAEVLIAESNSPHQGALHYALGWRTQALYGEPHHWHSGQCTGYAAITSLRPARGLAVALLCNADEALPHLQALLHAIIDQLEHRTPFDWSSVFPGVKKAEDTSVQDNTTPFADLTCVGRYHHAGYGEMRIEEEGGEMKAALQNSPLSVLIASTGDGALWQPEGYTTRLHLGFGRDDLVMVAPGAPSAIRFERLGC